MNRLLVEPPGRERNRVTPRKLSAPIAIPIAARRKRRAGNAPDAHPLLPIPVAQIDRRHVHGLDRLPIHHPHRPLDHPRRQHAHHTDIHLHSRLLHPQLLLRLLPLRLVHAERINAPPGRLGLPHPLVLLRTLLRLIIPLVHPLVILLAIHHPPLVHHPRPTVRRHLVRVHLCRRRLHRHVLIVRIRKIPPMHQRMRTITQAPLTITITPLGHSPPKVLLLPRVPSPFPPVLHLLRIRNHDMRHPRLLRTPRHHPTQPHHRPLLLRQLLDVLDPLIEVHLELPHTPRPHQLCPHPRHQLLQLLPQRRRRPINLLPVMHRHRHRLDMPRHILQQNLHPTPSRKIPKHRIRQLRKRLCQRIPTVRTLQKPQHVTQQL